MHEREPAGVVELGRLLVVELVVVAVAVVDVVVRADLVAEHDAEHVVRVVDSRVPAPDEDVPVRRLRVVDGGTERVGVERSQGQLDTDLRARVPEQLGRGHVHGRGLDGDQPEAQRLAVRRGADLAAALVLVPGRFQQRLGLRRVRIELLVGRDIEVPFAEPYGQDGAARQPVPGQRDVHQLLAVDRVAERLPDDQILEQRVPAGLRVVRDVDPDVVERERLQRDGLDVLRALQPLPDRRRDLGADVDSASAQALRHHVFVLEQDPGDLLGRGLGPPPVSVAGDLD